MELAGVDNPDRIQKLIEQSAELGFYNVIQPRERFGDQWTFERFLQPVDEAIKAQFTQELNATSNDSLILVPLIDGNTMEPSTGYPSAAYIAEEHIAAAMAAGTKSLLRAVPPAVFPLALQVAQLGGIWLVAFEELLPASTPANIENLQDGIILKELYRSEKRRKYPKIEQLTN